MSRFLTLALLVGLASCDSADSFGTEPSRFTATVGGAQAFDLSGAATYAIARESPLTTSILLTDADGPAIEFLFEGGSVRGTVYSIPANADATFETERFGAERYEASGGRVEITRTTETRATGTFSFTAERGAESVTVRGEFLAVRSGS